MVVRKRTKPPEMGSKEKKKLLLDINQYQPHHYLCQAKSQSAKAEEAYQKLMQVVLGKQLVFQACIQNIVIQSTSVRKAMIIKLTIVWEKGMTVMQRCRCLKYSELANQD